MTGATLYQQILDVLIETPTNGSAEPTTALFTRAEIMARCNYRQADFCKLTGCYPSFSTSLLSTPAHITVAQNDITLAVPEAAVDILEFAYDADISTETIIPKGAGFEATIFTDETEAAEVPAFYQLDTAAPLYLRLSTPALTSSTVRLVYTALPTTLPSPGDSTVLVVPDEFCPFVKYGVLADLFGKSGETYDPLRAQVCENLYELGVQVAMSWVKGSKD